MLSPACLSADRNEHAVQNCRLAVVGVHRQPSNRNRQLDPAHAGALTTTSADRRISAAAPSSGTTNAARAGRSSEVRGNLVKRRDRQRGRVSLGFRRVTCHHGHRQRPGVSGYTGRGIDQMVERSSRAEPPRVRDPKSRYRRMRFGWSRAAPGGAWGRPRRSARVRLWWDSAHRDVPSEVDEESAEGAPEACIAASALRADQPLPIPPRSTPAPHSRRARPPATSISIAAPGRQSFGTAAGCSSSSANERS